MIDAPLEAILRLPQGLTKGLHVRVRFLGEGPPVLLLHESPRSSAALLPLARRLADRFCCVMLDTPGFGLSDPMPMARPEIPDFARVALAAAEALGLPPLPVYGTHTGAAIAAAAAAQDPGRVTAAVLDGYAVFTAEEQAELLASYLPPFLPSLDGTHVAWIWARVRDQFAAFPWNCVSDATRLPFGPPPLDHAQAVVDDFLLAGDHYRVGYAAAFRYDHLAPLRAARVPIRVAARENDLLFRHMERARGVGALTTLHPLSADRAEWAAAIGALLAEHASGAATNAAALAARAAAHQGDRRIVNAATGPLVVRLDGPSAAPPVILLHDAPGGMADLDHLAQRLARARRVVRLNLPGLGASRLAPGAAPTLATLVAGAAEAIADLGFAEAPVVAHGASLPVALALPGAPPVLALDPWPQVAEGIADAVPDLAPRWDGAHLAAAFWWARDHDLFKPWTRRENAAGKPLGLERDAERINHRFRAIALGGPVGAEITHALYDADATDALSAARGRVLALLHPEDPDHAPLSSWAGSALGADRVLAAPREISALADAVSDALDRLA